MKNRLKRIFHLLTLVLISACSSSEELENYEITIEGDVYNVYVSYESKEPVIGRENWESDNPSYQRDQFLNG